MRNQTVEEDMTVFSLTRRIRFGALLPISLTLSACWEASTPLLEVSQSVAPLSSGEYLYYSDMEGDDADIVTLLKIPGGGYIYHNQDDDNALPLLAHEFDEGWYLLQVGPIEGTLLAIARNTPARTEVFDPECDEEIGALLGVERRKSRYSGYDCQFETLDAAVAAGRLIRARVESGTDVELNGWFERTPVERLEDAN